MAKPGFVVVLLVACALPSLSAEESNKRGVKTSFAVPVKRPLLCTRTIRLQGAMNVKSGKSEEKVPMSLEEEVQFIDEHSVLTKDHEEGERYFVKTLSKANGEINDPPLSGVKLAYARDSKETSAAVSNGRTLPQKTLQDLLRAFSTLGIWLGFPDEATIGQSYKVDLADLGTVLLSGELPVTTATSTLNLDAFDETTGVATFRGEAALTEKGRVEEQEITASYACQCTIRVHPVERRIISLSLEGKYRFEASGSFLATGEGTCIIELSTEIGEAVEKARKQPPKFRERVQRVPKLGVQVMLPSHYARIPDDQGLQRYFRSLEPSTSIAIILLQGLEGDASKPQAFYDAMAASIRKNDKNAKFQKATSSLGPGFVCLTTDKDQQGDLLKVRAEVYPLGRSFLLYKLVASPKAYSAAEKELVKARSSLKALK